jgi:hypothetical protein
MGSGPCRAPVHSLDLPSQTRNVYFGSRTGAAELRDQAHAGDTIGTWCAGWRLRAARSYLSLVSNSDRRLPLRLLSDLT